MAGLKRHYKETETNNRKLKKFNLRPKSWRLMSWKQDLLFVTWRDPIDILGTVRGGTVDLWLYYLPFHFTLWSSVYFIARFARFVNSVECCPLFLQSMLLPLWDELYIISSSFWASYTLFPWDPFSLLESYVVLLQGAITERDTTCQQSCNRAVTKL